ncbi:MAG TPA: FKBP-type peptidyl-prolyl cis-trans isomerase, partial [Terriglobales bacterium]|nr:FKBP-type peptidyl-prolyl cis-trans isomerase [Terriglobales bacterium]
MTFKLCSLALLAATAATAQTSKPAVHHTTTTHHTATSKTSAKVSAIPHVPGIPKTLYALKYIDIRVGKGPLAETHKWYTVHYTGWFPDGTKFDSSFDHPGGEPIVFPYGARRVITGWDTGFQGMHVGGKRRLFVPYQLAYGELGNPPRMPAKANLIFDVELVAQSDTPPEPKPEPKPEAAPTKPAEPEAKPAEPEAKPAEPATET